MAFVVTVVATGANLVYLVATYGTYGLPILSALAVLFGSMIAVYEWRMLMSLRGAQRALEMRGSPRRRRGAENVDRWAETVPSLTCPYRSEKKQSAAAVVFGGDLLRDLCASAVSRNSAQKKAPGAGKTPGAQGR